MLITKIYLLEITIDQLDSVLIQERGQKVPTHLIIAHSQLDYQCLVLVKTKNRICLNNLKLMSHLKSLNHLEPPNYLKLSKRKIKNIILSLSLILSGNNLCKRGQNRLSNSHNNSLKSLEMLLKNCLKILRKDL